MEVVELVGAVIDWHARHLVPCARTLTDDARCHFVQADFFDMVQRGALFGGQLVDAILADIDHSPRQVLHPSHAALYTADGLRRLAARLHPRGVFGLWSDGEPDDAVVALLGDEFAAATAHVVTFPNPYTGDDSSSTVYIATM